MALTKIPSTLLETSGHLVFGDNEWIKMGASNDLLITHDGSSSYIIDNGSGGLTIAGSGVYIKNAAYNEQMISAVENGAVELYHDNSKKLETTSTGVKVLGNITNASGDLTLDVGGDINLDAGGANINFNDDGTSIGHIEMAGQNLEIKSKVADKDIIFKGNDNGTAVTALTLDMSAAGAATFNSDVVVGGNLTVSGTSTTLNTATLDVEDKNITVNKGSGDTSGSADGAGLTIQDAVDASNDATMLWNASADKFVFSHPINSASYIEATGNISTGANAGRLRAGGSNEMQLYFDGSHGHLSSSTGNFTVDAAGDITLDAGGGDILFKDDGTLVGTIGGFASNNMIIKSEYSDGDVIIQGNDGGSGITALTLDMSDAGTANFNNHIVIPNDSGRLKIGAGGDILLFHSGGVNYLKMATADQSFKIQGVDGSSTIDAFTLDMANAGRAQFNGDVGINMSPNGYGKLSVNSTGVILALRASSGAGQLGFYEGGAGRFYLQTLNGDDGLSFMDGDGTTERMRVDANGKLGIGITAPFTPLHVSTEGAPDSTGNVTSGLVVSHGAGGNAIKIGVHDSGALNYIQSGYVNNIQVARNFAIFYGANEGMRLDTSGRVGIGTTSPGGSAGNDKLTVAGRLGIKEGTSELQMGTGSDYAWMEAWDGTSDRAPKSHVCINPWGGNVGIGLTAPTAKLDIRGSVNSEQVVITGASNSGRGLSIQTAASGGQQDAGVVFDAQDTESGANPYISLKAAGTEVAKFSYGSADKYPTSGNGGIGGNGANLHLQGDDSEIRMANQLIHSDNSGNTKFTIRNAYGHHSALAELSLDGGFVSINCGSSYTEMVKATTGEVIIGNASSTGYYLKVRTQHGFGNQGPQNSSYYHNNTDRAYNYWGQACYASGGFHTYSDETLKKEITTLTGALDSVAKMNGVTFKWKDPEKRGGNSATGKQFGVIAQNMLEVDSELPILNDDPLETQENLDDSSKDTSYYSMDYSRLTPYFIEAIKELKAKNEALEARIATLEG